MHDGTTYSSSYYTMTVDVTAVNDPPTGAAGTVSTPEDTAWAAVYLASDESSWVTGSSMFVDGGYTCQ